ncbi:uncharacterized protein LOC110912466 isoform X2 [Helianthus annuus]|uniref:uncharacterized protein LOC110912466 isoform X2 n=1 Tax=Helianthus annuus TaxID=4232 RepID=UPI001652CBE9|nr:uncharacterized protein LOC110912466 isoform X2 [Helianthus annuus]
MARSTADAGRCRGFVAGGGRGQAGGKVWSLKRTWQQQENWATTREQGSNKEAAGGKVWSLKRTWQQQENWAATREQGSNKAVLRRKNYLEAVLPNFLLVLFQTKEDVKYEGYLLEKYGEESSQHRELDKELWYRASGGKKRGKVYGLSNLKNDFNV